MSSVRVHCLSVSLDGYASGEGQRLDAPFEHAGGRLLAWFDATRTFRQIHALAGGTTNADPCRVRLPLGGRGRRTAHQLSRSERRIVCRRPRPVGSATSGASRWVGIGPTAS